MLLILHFSAIYGQGSDQDSRYENASNGVQGLSNECNWGPYSSNGTRAIVPKKRLL